jgi:uncharacterized protein (TIGR02596 family)
MTRSSTLNYSPTALAFTLLELLVVLGVIALISLLVVPGLGVTSAYQVTTATSQLKSTVELARQKAVTSGQPVELRFYKQSDGNHFIAYRIVEITPAGEKFLRVNRMPTGIVMRQGLPGSTLLDVAQTMEESSPPPGTDGDGARFIRFLSDGSLERIVSETNAVWVSIAREMDKVEDHGLPGNFATVSIDTLLGTSTTYRP